MSEDIMTAIWGAGKEELQKTASEDTFIDKLAGQYGVDITKLSDDQKELLEQSVVEDLREQGLLEEDENQEKVASPKEMAAEVWTELQKIASGEETMYEDQIEVDYETRDALQALYDNGHEEAAEKLAQAYISTHGVEKTASSFEKLADDRALEILDAAGYDPSTGEERGEADEGQLDDALNVRALEKLAEAGWDVDDLIGRVKVAEEGEKTYPISRYLTNAITPTISGATLGGVLGAHAGGGSAKGKALKAILGGLGGAAAGGALGYGSSAMNRGIHARAAKGRAAKGQKGIGKSEQEILAKLRK